MKAMAPIVISQEQSKHIAVLSFVCACLIVLLHCYYRPDSGVGWWLGGLISHSGLCRIAVPWFFLVSGFFAVGRYGERNWYFGAIQRRVRTIVVPFYVWMIIHIVFGAALCLLAKFAGKECGAVLPFENESPLSIFLHLIGLNPSAPIGVVWYLRMVIFLVLLLPLIVQMIKKLRWVYIVVVFCLYLTYEFAMKTGHMDNSYFDYYFSLRGVAYFSIGVALRLGIYLNVSRGIIIMGTCLLPAKLFASHNGDLGLAAVCDVLMVPSLIYFMWSMTRNVHLPRILVSNSFALYLIHDKFLTLTILPVTALGFRDVMFTSSCVTIMRCVSTITCSVALAVILRRTMPRLASVLFGGR